MAHAFSPRIIDAGFDKNASPPWQMVPLGSSRRLILSGVNPRTIIACDRSDILRVTSTVMGSDIHLTLTGAKAGTTLVECIPPPSATNIMPPVFSLDVSVKKRKKVKVTFHYVEDMFGNKTGRKIGDLDALIQSANTILTPQANVEIVRKDASTLVMPKNINLGDVVRKLPKRSTEPATDNEFAILKKHRDATAHITLFFVHEWEHDESPSIDNTAATTYWRKGSFKKKKMIVFEDDMPNASVTLAHEMVHALGHHGHSDEDDHLIAKGSIRTGKVIPKQLANLINE